MLRSPASIPDLESNRKTGYNLDCARYPQAVRIAPAGQDKAPKRSGRIPHPVRLAPPPGQDDR